MTDAPRETAAPVTPPREHPWAFAFLAGAWCLGLGGVVQAAAYESHAFRDELLHVAVVASAALLASRAIVDRAARRLLGLRGPVVAWRAFAAGALALAAYYAYAISYMLGASWSFFAWFGRFWELEPEAFVVPAITAVAALALAKLPVVTRRRLRAELWLSVALAVVLLGAGAWRAQRSPAVDRYVPSLALLGELPTAPDSGHWDVARAEESSTAYTDHAFGAVVVRRFVFRYREQCVLRLGPRADQLPVAASARYPDLTDCGAFEVRHDARRDLYVLTRRDQWGGATVHAFQSTSVEPLTVGGARMADYRDAFTVPRSWLWGSAAILAFALAGIARSWRSRRALRGASSWRQGTLRADQTIALDDGALVPCPYGSQLTPGPVVLLAVPRPSGRDPFRGGGAVTPERDEVLQGTLADVIAARESEVDAARAYAVTATLLSAAPLVAGAIERLLP